MARANQGPPWSAEEEATLARLYWTAGVRAAAEALPGRSMDAIYTRATRNGLGTPARPPRINGIMGVCVACERTKYLHARRMCKSCHATSRRPPCACGKPAKTASGECYACYGWRRRQAHQAATADHPEHGTFDASRLDPAPDRTPPIADERLLARARQVAECLAASPAPVAWRHLDTPEAVARDIVARCPAGWFDAKPWTLALTDDGRRALRVGGEAHSPPKGWRAVGAAATAVPVRCEDAGLERRPICDGPARVYSRKVIRGGKVLKHRKGW